MNEKSAALTEGIYLILISLLSPRHGYAVMQNVEKLTHGRVTLGAGTLYGAINNLLEKHWIRAVGHSLDSRKKEYAITDLGKQVLQIEIMRLGELVNIGLKELEGGASNENNRR
jgi:DNA-binding PadR family transcriptional regulator